MDGDLRFLAAVRAAREKAPPGMGDFAVRELVTAVLGAADRYLLGIATDDPPVEADPQDPLGR